MKKKIAIFSFLLFSLTAGWGVSLSVVKRVEGLHFYNFYRSFEAGEGIGVIGYYSHTATPREIEKARRELQQLIERGIARQKGEFEKQLEKGMEKFNPPLWLSGFFPKEVGKEGGKWLFITLLKWAPKIGRFETPVGKLGEVGIIVVEGEKVRKIPLGVEAPVMDISISPSRKIAVLLDYSVNRKLVGRLLILTSSGQKIGEWLFPNLTYQIEFAPGEGQEILALLFTNPSSRWWQEKGIRFFDWKRGKFLPYYLTFKGAGSPGKGGVDIGFDYRPPYFQFTSSALITADGKLHSYPSLRPLPRRLPPMGLWWGVSPDSFYLISDRTIWETGSWKRVGKLPFSPYSFSFSPATSTLWITFPFMAGGEFKLPSLGKIRELKKVVAPTPLPSGKWVVGVSHTPPLKILLFRVKKERRELLTPADAVASYPLPSDRVVGILPLSSTHFGVITPNHFLLFKITP
jgi:hypothetical protein